MSVGLEVGGQPPDGDAKSDFSRDTTETERKPEIPFVAPSTLEQQSHDFDQSGQEAKAWLVSYGDQKPDTLVSWRFLLEEQDYPTSRPYSMLPFLGRWLTLWLDRSVTESQDRTNVSWLLQYIADYVQLGHCKLDHQEICELCSALLYVCNNARQHSHIEGCLAVFLSIAQTGLFPRECLKEVLGTLSSAIVILERPLSRVADCVYLLASGPLAQDTVTALYAQLFRVLEIQDDEEAARADSQSQILTQARGAARLLASLLQTLGPEEKFVVGIGQLLKVLKKAAEANFLRLATEILTLTTKFLQSSRIEELVGEQQLITLLLDIYVFCKNSTVIPDLAENSSSKSKTSKEEQVKRERRYKRDHEIALNFFRAAVATVLPLMDTENAERLWETIKYGMDSLRAESRASVIEYIKEHEICKPGRATKWYQELNLLIDKIVIGKTSLTDTELEKELQYSDQSSSAFIQEQVQERVRQRIDILHLIVRAIHDCAERGDETVEGLPNTQTTLSIGTRALEKLLTIFTTERNSKEMQAFLKEMIQLSEAATPTGDRPYADLIVETLRDRILTNAPSDNTADGTYFDGTKALRSIFLSGLNSPTAIANKAYQALLRIANYQLCKSRRARLAAMTLLFRIRCDSSGMIYIDTSSDSAEIASALCKTDESMAAMFSESDASNEEMRQKLQKVYQKQLWMYPEEDRIVKSWVIPESSTIGIKSNTNGNNDRDIEISDWIWLVHANLLEDKDWETYSFAIVHFGSQLGNTCLFEHSQEILASLRGFLAGRVRERTSMFEPPKDIGLDKADVALCIYHILTRLIPYAKMQPPSQNYDSSRRGVDLVRAFRAGMAEYEGTARSCIHALSICCFETPDAIGTEYPSIIQTMAQKISQSHLLVHILEFLAQVARLPHLHEHFMETEIRQIFGICINALKALRPSDTPRASSLTDAKRISAVARSKGGLLTPYRAAMLKEKGLTQYSCALAYHTMIFWFLSIPISRRHDNIKYILPTLIWRDASGQESIDQQTVVLVDMMQRTAFSDLPETARDESFDGDDFDTSSYIDGNSVITIETHKTNGKSQITKRQASGTTHAIYQPLVQDLTPHHDRAFRDLPDRARASHTFLNMIGSAIPIPVTEQPLKLNSNEPYVSRALNIIDRMPTVDSHGIAVTLLKNGQTSEPEYLANETGTPSFDAFLSSIGTRVSLQPPCRFIPFGLVFDQDGKETVAWRDRINEIVYQISTLMPNVEEDQYQARKKSHLGNCLVLIIFNQSNQPWKWQYFQSQATLVNIVITPANRVSDKDLSDDYEHEYFQVEVLTKEEYQNISAAAEAKVVSRTTLAQFVRMLALNANIFSGCARNESTGDAEFPSSWRYRLKEIVQLRERTQQRVHDNEDTFAKRYDFNRWT